MTDRLHTDPDGCVTCRELRAENERLAKHIDAAGDGANLSGLLDLYHQRMTDAEDVRDELRDRLRYVARLLGVDSPDPREDELASAVRRLRDQGRWRPVSEPAPAGEIVLVLLENEHGERDYTLDCAPGLSRNAVYWRPLPEGPGDDAEPGSPVWEGDCPSCGAHLDVREGDDEGDRPGVTWTPGPAGVGRAER